MDSLIQMNDQHLAYKMLDDVLATLRNQSFKKSGNIQIKDSDL